MKSVSKVLLMVAFVVFFNCNEKKPEVKTPVTRESVIEDFKKVREDMIQRLSKSPKFESIDIYLSKDFYIEDSYNDPPIQLELKGDFSNIAQMEDRMSDIISALKKGDLTMVDPPKIPKFIDVTILKQESKKPLLHFNYFEDKWILTGISFHIPDY